MCRSIDEVKLFKDNEDKLKYISFIKKYQKINQFQVIGYCLMDNHAHLMIDANGSDISTVMHGINFSYAQYYNGRHHRHGHLFQDRFKSKMVKNDEYLFVLSAYIHNNPTDISGYKKHPEKYEFSSLSVYLGLRQDPYDLVEDSFILSMFGKDPKTARRNYMRLVFHCSDESMIEAVEFKNEPTEYRSQRHILVRNADPEKIVDFIAKKLNVSHIKVHMKNSKKMVEAKALIVIIMRSLCNAKCGEICHVLGGI
jgi:REP element-mobilizing transposase RayT